MCSIRARPAGATSGAIAVAAAAAAATPGATAIDVAPSSTVPRAALSPPPIAAVNSGCPVVMTGTRKCSDSVVVMNGMRAPPPTEATATRSAARIPLRSKVSCTTPTKSASGARIASSSSLRVSRTSLRCPGSSATSEVTAAVDNRSLAPRHWARSRVSEPIAEVPDKSMVPAAGQVVDDVSQQRLVDEVAGQVGVADGRADRRETVGGVDERDAGARAAEVAQCDHAASRHTRVVLQRSERRRGVGDERRRGRLLELRHRCQGVAQRVDGGGSPVCGVGHRDGFGGWPAVATAYSIARSASASTLSAICVEPSAATMPTGSPTRSTKSVMIRPRSC